MIAALWTFTPALAQSPLAIPAPPPPPVVLKPVPTEPSETPQPPPPAAEIVEAPEAASPSLGISAAVMDEYDDRRLRVLPAERQGWRYLLPSAKAPRLDFAKGVNVAAVDLAPLLVVSEGERLLSVPTLMDILGDNPAALRERIERKQWTANAWTAVSALGLVGAAVSYRMSEGERRPWLIGSASMLVGGLIFGGNAQRRANRLQNDLDLSFERRELVERVRRHNDALARELGIEPVAESAP